MLEKELGWTIYSYIVDDTVYFVEALIYTNLQSVKFGIQIIIHQVLVHSYVACVNRASIT